MFKVLIIDDEPWSRSVVKSLGRWADYGLNVVGEAEDGTDGLKKIEELQPDIVITDMRMPGIDGVELLQELVERYPSLKVIVMSGYDDFVYLKQAIRSRAKEYLLKPIDPEELNAALDRCVSEFKLEREAEDAWRTPLAFGDTEVLNQYLDIRRQIYGYLLELSAEGVVQGFSKLDRFLIQASGKADVLPILKVNHDFVLMLEEFAAGNEISFDKLGGAERPIQASNGSNGLPDMIRRLSGMFRDVILLAETQRKSRIRLDLSEVQSYIDRHYHEPISLETVAQQFFVSKEHLSRSFKSQTGENLSDYIVKKRMEKARELIVQDGISIKNAAELAGYVDLAYFYRVFKKHFGVTPGELRKDE